jgi:hypothetical protein
VLLLLPLVRPPPRPLSLRARFCFFCFRRRYSAGVLHAQLRGKAVPGISTAPNSSRSSNSSSSSSSGGGGSGDSSGSGGSGGGNSGADCAAQLLWDNDSGWCRNGSAPNCTTWPVLPASPWLADYGGASNLLECVPTCVVLSCVGVVCVRVWVYRVRVGVWVRGLCVCFCVSSSPCLSRSLCLSLPLGLCLPCLSFSLSLFSFAGRSVSSIIVFGGRYFRLSCSAKSLAINQ